MFAKIYKINYKNRYFPIWDYASAEVIFAPAETSAVALGRRSRYRIRKKGSVASPKGTWALMMLSCHPSPTTS